MGWLKIKKLEYLEKEHTGPILEGTSMRAILKKKGKKKLNVKKGQKGAKMYKFENILKKGR